MATFSFKPTRGNPDLIAAVKGNPRAAQIGIRQGMWLLGKDLVKDAKRYILEKPKSGRTYISKTKTGRRKKHIASAKGESPASDTGELWRSLNFLVSGWQRIIYGASAPYANFLENEDKLDRPFLRKALINNRENGKNLLEQEMKRAMEAGMK